MSWINYSSEHRLDLAKSRLTFKTVSEAGVYSMCPRDIGKVMKWKGSAEINSVLVFPYLMEKGFSRYKLFWMPKGHARRFRYYQKKDTGSRLYLTKSFVKQCEYNRGNSLPVYITEGEKKALALSQAGYPACGLAGVWNFGEAVLERLAGLGVKELRYIPDDDVHGRKDLEVSVVRFNNILSEIGCKLIVLKKGDM